MGEKVKSQGHYYWQLVFDYDNSNNSGTIVEEFELREKKTIDKREFLKRKINVKHGFSFNSKTSYSIKYIGVSGEANYNIHEEISKEYETINETNEKIEKESVHKKTYTIGPHSKLRLYVLCFQMDGAFVKSGIVSTNPTPDLKVFIDFEIKRNILGLVELEHRLMHTFPAVHNQPDWEQIRNTIISCSAMEDETRFRQLVKKLGSTKPSTQYLEVAGFGRFNFRLSNQVEWNEIRGTCGEILSEWDSSEKQLLFNKLLRRLSIICPVVDNKVEWAAIRDVCNNILNNIVTKSF